MAIGTGNIRFALTGEVRHPCRGIEQGIVAGRSIGLWPCRPEAAILAKLRNKEGKSAHPWGRCATKIEPMVQCCYKWVYPIEAVEVTAAGRHRRVGKLILLQKSRVATRL